MSKIYFNPIKRQWSCPDTHHAYQILTEHGAVLTKCRRAENATDLMWVFIDLFGDGFEDVWADSVNWHQVYHEINR